MSYEQPPPHTPPEQAVSENGKTNAQNYYMNNRPLEGVPTLHKPSATTVYGAEWKPASVTPGITSEKFGR